MAAPRFKITYSDDRQLEVRVSPKAQVMFERHFQKTMSAYSRDPGAEHLYYLAWAGVHCAGMEPADFEEFLNKLQDVEPLDSAVAEADPTQTAPGQGPSSG